MKLWISGSVELSGGCGFVDNEGERRKDCLGVRAKLGRRKYLMVLTLGPWLNQSQERQMKENSRCDPAKTD